MSVRTGRLERRRVPRSAHAEWSPHPDRDPIGLLQHQAATRDPDLIPICHQRMAKTALSYFRGAAYPMAYADQNELDLADMRRAVDDGRLAG